MSNVALGKEQFSVLSFIYRNKYVSYSELELCLCKINNVASIVCYLDDVAALIAAIGAFHEELVRVLQAVWRLLR